MRSRVEQVVEGNVHGMWVGTFHGLAHRLLRMHFQEAKLPQAFQVLDSDDQLRLVKRIIRSLNLDEKRWPAKQAQWYINGKKDDGIRPHHIDTQYDPTEQIFVQIYSTYQQACDRAGLVDFAELLLRAHELWLNNPVLAGPLPAKVCPYPGGRIPGYQCHPVCLAHPAGQGAQQCDDSR